MGNHRLEVHHSIPRSRGGSDDEWNLHGISEYDHAYEHALNYVLFEHAPQMDFRMKGWSYLPSDLQEACKEELRIRNRLYRPLPPKTFEHQSKAGKKGGQMQGPKNREHMRSISHLGMIASAERARRIRETKPPKPQGPGLGSANARRNKTPEMRKISSERMKRAAKEGHHPSQIKCCCLVCKKETNPTSITRFHKH